MKNALYLVLVCFLSSGNVATQDIEDLLPTLRNKAIFMDIKARILEKEAKDTKEVWNTTTARVTFPGKAVPIKLVGANIVVDIWFTPYIRKDGQHTLMAQGQIWVDVPKEGMRFQTIMNNIPITYGEQVSFLPLGSEAKPGQPIIEILLKLRPYMDKEVPDLPLVPE